MSFSGFLFSQERLQKDASVISVATMFEKLDNKYRHFFDNTTGRTARWSEMLDRFKDDDPIKRINYLIEKSKRNKVDFLKGLKLLFAVRNKKVHDEILEDLKLPILFNGQMPSLVVWTAEVIVDAFGRDFLKRIDDDDEAALGIVKHHSAR